MREQAQRWPMFHEVLRRGRLLEQMLAALGISARTAAHQRHGEAIGEARAVCMSCPHARECEVWLERVHSGGVPQDERVLPVFCPNLRYLVGCLEQAASQRRGGEPVQ